VQLAWLTATTDIHLAEGIYRVQAGPYPDRAQALQTAARIEQELQLKPVVVTR